ncbi:MAG: hypothetical protein RL522_2183 [Pseudomonadota bacterium]|jgi:hypothetical protein
MSNLPLSSRGLAARLGRVACLGFPLLVLAGDAAMAQTPVACPQELPATTAWSDREASLSAQTHLSDACLKQLVRQCDVEADAGFLDGASAAACSLRYEALLREGFRGDFNSFLRWWQSEPPVASQ